MVESRGSGPDRGRRDRNLWGGADPLLAPPGRPGGGSPLSRPPGAAQPWQVRPGRCRRCRSSRPVGKDHNPSPRPGPGMSRRSGPCGWSVGPQPKTARRRSTRCGPSSSTGPDDLRQAFRGVTIHKLVAGAVRLRPADPTTADGATRFALRELARRVQHLDAEIDRIDAILRPLVAATAPALVARHGIGTETAATLLVSAGDNPGRLRNEASFAHLCGSAPIDASSGLIKRQRLNPRGDRNANHALWRIVMVRMGSEPRNPPLRRPPHPRREEQAGDHPLPQALRRPPGLRRHQTGPRPP